MEGTVVVWLAHAVWKLWCDTLHWPLTQPPKIETVYGRWGLECNSAGARHLHLVNLKQCFHFEQQICRGKVFHSCLLFCLSSCSASGDGDPYSDLRVPTWQVWLLHLWCLHCEYSLFWSHFKFEIWAVCHMQIYWKCISTKWFSSNTSNSQCDASWNSYLLCSYHFMFHVQVATVIMTKPVEVWTPICLLLRICMVCINSLHSMVMFINFCFLLI